MKPDSDHFCLDQVVGGVVHLDMNDVVPSRYLAWVDDHREGVVRRTVFPEGVGVYECLGLDPQH